MQSLGWITVGLTYLLMVWGNLVSSTGSGLACPDWPLCHGTITPAISFPVVLEWGHRLLAFSAAVMIVLTIFKAFTSSLKTESSLKRSTRSLLVLLGIQVLLGGTTVMLGLSVLVSTVHLIIATLVFSGLITLACVMTWENPIVSPVSSKVGRLAIAGLIGLLIQFTLGALVRHGHSGLACPNFPNCLNSILPIPFTFETGIAFFHRWWGILLLGVFVQLASASARTTPALSKASNTVLGIAILQVLLGIGTVMGKLNTETRAIHAAVGYALWGVLFYISIRAGRLRWLWDAPKSSRKPSSVLQQSHILPS